MLKPFTLICILFFSLIAHAEEPLVRWKNDMETIGQTSEWINQTTILFDSIAINHFSRTDSQNIYGLGYKGSFPEATLNKSIEITLKAGVRFSTKDAAFGLALSVSKGDSIVFWDSKNVNRENPGEWSKVSVSFRLPANFVVSENTLIFYGWNRDGKFTCDFDDLEIEIHELPERSFLPQELNLWSGQSDVKFNRRITGNIFSVDADTTNGSIRIFSTDGDSLINRIGYYLEFKNTRKDKRSKKIFIEKFDKLSIEENGEVVKLKAIALAKPGKVNIEVTLDNLSGSLTITSSVHFNSNVFLQRSTLVMQYGIDVGSVLKKNSLIDSAHLRQEYWLEKEGVILKGKASDYITYRNILSSSLQLSTTHKLLLLNNDFDLDHPMLYFPPMKKSSSFFLERSSIAYKKGDELKGTIKFSVIQKQMEPARVLKNPNGFLSSLIWTEHADFSDIRVQRAVNFGSENIHAADSATGGFVGHSIPVTKSVFYHNPTGLKNAEKDVRFSDESVSIKGSDIFTEFLHQLHQKKFEICLHTPDPFTTTAAYAEEAMAYMQKNFGSCNWIDHGYDNAPSSNREDIVCSGADTLSEYYMGDLWKKYGVKYFWNNYYEDASLYSNTSFYSFFTTPYSGWDDAFPTPEYFANPVKKDLISWRTTFTLDPADGSLWDYYFNEPRLNDLVYSRGNCILHCYPARVDSTTGFYSYNGNEIVVNSEFDKALSRLRNYGDNGLIWLTTVKEMLDYRLLLENVTIDYGRGSAIIVSNRNDKMIRGVSLITAAESVTAGEKNIRIKKSGSESIAIFDLAPKEKLILELK